MTAKNGVKSGNTAKSNQDKKGETVKTPESKKANPIKLVLLSVLLKIQTDYNAPRIEQCEKITNELPEIHLNGATIKKIIEKLKNEGIAENLNLAIMDKKFTFSFTAERGRNSGALTSIEPNDIAIQWNNDAHETVKTIWAEIAAEQAKKAENGGIVRESIKVSLDDLDSLDFEEIAQKTREKLQSDKERGAALKKAREEKKGGENDKKGKKAKVAEPEIEDEDEDEDEDENLL